MAWFGVFASNLAGSLFWPLLLVTILGVVIGIHTYLSRSRLQEHSSNWNLATGRMHLILQSLTIGWFLWACLNAVPEPDYIYKTKIVAKEVTVAAKFQDVYKQCVDDTDIVDEEGYRDPSAIDAACTERSWSLVNMKPITKIVYKDRIKYVPMADDARYRDVFNTCMGKDLQEGGWSVDNATIPAADMRQKRIQLCHEQAKEVIED